MLDHANTSPITRDYHCGMDFRSSHFNLSCLVTSQRLLQYFDGHEQSAYRFMPMLKILFPDRETGQLDWGVSCQACRLAAWDVKRGYRDCNIIYSTLEYIEYFQKCAVSQRRTAQKPNYINPTGKDQAILDARFLSYLSNFKF